MTGAFIQLSFTRTYCYTLSLWQLAVATMHFYIVQTLHDILHSATTWLTVGLVLGSITSIYVFFKLFEGDLFRAD